MTVPLECRWPVVSLLVFITLLSTAVAKKDSSAFQDVGTDMFYKGEKVSLWFDAIINWRCLSSITRSAAAVSKQNMVRECFSISRTLLAYRQASQEICYTCCGCSVSNSVGLSSPLDRNILCVNAFLYLSVSQLITLKCSDHGQNKAWQTQRKTSFTSEGSVWSFSNNALLCPIQNKSIKRQIDIQLIIMYISKKRNTYYHRIDLAEINMKEVKRRTLRYAGGEIGKVGELKRRGKEKSKNEK